MNKTNIIVIGIIQKTKLNRIDVHFIHIIQTNDQVKSVSQVDIHFIDIIQTNDQVKSVRQLDIHFIDIIQTFDQVKSVRQPGRNIDSNHVTKTADDEQLIEKVYTYVIIFK